MNLSSEPQTFPVLRKIGRRKYSQFSLKLTSMMDMFTILLFFLLNSFSSEGEIMMVAKDLKLPESTAEKPPKAASVVAITNEWLLFDGRPIERIDNVLANKTLLIESLANELKNLRAFTESLGQLNSRMDFTGKICIQGDKEIPYDVLKKVMFTCGQIGYNNMLLAVSKPG